MLDGMPEIAEQVVGLQVRRGVPVGVGGLIDVVKSPAYATGVGLVKYGASRLRQAPRIQMPAEVAATPAAHLGGWGRKLGIWIKEVF
jgi:cell division ATPase FtsA